MKLETCIRSYEIAETISSLRKELKKMRRTEKTELKEALDLPTREMHIEIIEDNIVELGNAMESLYVAYIALMGIDDTDKRAKRPK